MKLAAKIGRGVLKATTKIDFDDNGKTDLTLDASLPDIDLADYFKVPKECLLIFDDLERCSIKVSDVLGYINAFVEHEGFRAIIVANEEEILKRDDERYAEIKEKLIGQTLQVRSTLETALAHFIALVRNDGARAYLETHVDEIKLLHSQSQTENLRLLKYALWDYERFSSCLTDVHWSNSEAMSAAFRIILALSFEMRSGRVKGEELAEITSMAARFGKGKDAQPTSVDHLKARYPEVEFMQSLISAELLRALFVEGWVDSTAVKETLDQSLHYASPTTMPAWKAAWHGWDFGDEEFESAVAKVEEQFSQREFVIPGEMFHAFGLRLMFSDVGIIGLTRAQVVAEAKAYIDDLQRSDKFPDPFLRDSWERTSWEGLGYFDAQSSEFEEIRQYFDLASEKMRRERLPSIGAELLKLVSKDAQQYFRKLCLNAAVESPFYNVPVLATIDPEEFVDHILALSPEGQRVAFTTFQGRYEGGMLQGKLKEEKPWLVAVKAALEKKSASLRPMSKYRIANRIGHNIDPFLLPVPTG